MPADEERQRPVELQEQERNHPLSPEPGQPIAPAPDRQDQLQPGAGKPVAPELSSVGPPIPDSVINRAAGTGVLLVVAGIGLVVLIVLALVIWFVITHLH